MERPSVRCVIPAVVALCLHGCLLPAIDETGTSREVGDDELDAAQAEMRESDAANVDGSVLENPRDVLDATSAGTANATRDAAAGIAASGGSDGDAAGGQSSDPSSIEPVSSSGPVSSDVGSTSDTSASLTSTGAASDDAGVCGTWGEACCAHAPSCGNGLLCQSSTCLPPARERLRAAYSHVPNGSQVASLEYLEFSAVAGKMPERRLFTRPNIVGLVGSGDGERLAFLANHTSDVNSTQVVWLLDGVSSGAAPLNVASSNPALPRGGLFADGSLDNLISCSGSGSGLEACDQLELYRRSRSTFTSIATNVWLPLVGDDNGLLFYNDGANTFWVDLTELELEPQFVMSNQDPESVLWIQPGQLAMSGRTACIFDVLAGSAPNGSKNQWTAYAIQLGRTELVPLASGIGLFTCYVQDDGSSVVLATTDGETQSSKLVRYSATSTGFAAGEELFEQGIDLGAGTPGNPGLFTTPVSDGYHRDFAFFGTPAATSGGTVYLTPYAIDVGTSTPHALTDEWCEVIASGHDMVSPQTVQSKFLARAGSTRAWMHCNRKVGYADASLGESFTVVDDSCIDCSPATFAAVGDGLVFSQFTSDALLTPHYYVTDSDAPRDIIAGGEQIGQMRDIFVAQASAADPSVISAWNLDGNVRVDLPRTWLKRSRTEAGVVTLDASPELDIEPNPLAGLGFTLHVSRHSSTAPAQALTNLAEYAACAAPKEADSGNHTVADGTVYEFAAERRGECTDGAGTRWLIALRAGDHDAQLVYHDPPGTAEQAFYALVDSLHIDAARLPKAESLASNADGGPAASP